MTEGRSWAEVNAAHDRSVERLKDRARQVYGQMVAHVAQEAAHCGARLNIMPPGTVLPKTATDAPLALRMDVTAGTVLYARQPHTAEPAGEKHRSWRVDLDVDDRPPNVVRRGLSRMVEDVARLHGNDIHTRQPSLTFD